MNTYSTPAERIAKFKGEFLKHAVPVEVLGIACDHKRHPRNSSKTVIYRRWLPFGATAATPNDIVVDPVLHETEEGVTPDADTLDKQDITVVLRQYACLYMYTDEVADLYEDDVPPELKVQCGERMGLVREMIKYGVLRGCTNRFYSGGASRATVSDTVTLNLLRNVSRSIQGNRGKTVTKILAPSANYNTAPVEASYLVFCSTDMESDVRDLPGFIKLAEYGSRKPLHMQEIGSLDRFRFVVSPELKPYLGAGAAVGATGLLAADNTNVDVYPIIVCAADAFSDVALRGMNSFEPSHIPVGKKDKTDPLGQRGYVGCKFYDAAFIQNDGWMAVVECGASELS